MPTQKAFTPEMNGNWKVTWPPKPQFSFYNWYHGSSPQKKMQKTNYFWLHLLGQVYFMKLIWAHHFIHLYIHIFIHAVFIGNLQCNVYFTTSCKYREEYSIVPDLQKAVVYRGRNYNFNRIWGVFWYRYPGNIMTAFERAANLFILIWMMRVPWITEYGGHLR